MIVPKGKLIIIGGAVDVASGAAYDYPQDIRVAIERG